MPPVSRARGGRGIRTPEAHKRTRAHAHTRTDAREHTPTSLSVVSKNTSLPILPSVTRALENARKLARGTWHSIGEACRAGRVNASEASDSDPHASLTTWSLVLSATPAAAHGPAGVVGARTAPAGSDALKSFRARALVYFATYVIRGGVQAHDFTPAQISCLAAAKTRGGFDTRTPYSPAAAGRFRQAASTACKAGQVSHEASHAVPRASVVGSQHAGVALRSPR